MSRPRSAFEVAYYGLLWFPLVPLLAGVAVAWVVDKVARPM